MSVKTRWHYLDKDFKGLPKFEHQLNKLGTSWWQCMACRRSWASKPRSHCLGIRTFDDWKQAKELYDTVTGWRKKGYKVYDHALLEPIAYHITEDGKIVTALYSALQVRKV